MILHLPNSPKCSCWWSALRDVLPVSMQHASSTDLGQSSGTATNITHSHCPWSGGVSTPQRWPDCGISVKKNLFSCNIFIFKCLFVSVTKVSVHFLICFYLLKVSKTEIFANIFADVISEGSWWRQQQQHLVHSVHYCPIMRHTPWQTCNPCLTKPSCLHILTRKVQQRIHLDNMAFSSC